MGELQPIPSAVVVAAALIAAVTDVWKFKVYDALTMPLLAGGLIYHAAVGGWAGLSGSVVGMVCGFGVLFIFLLMGGFGFGDVKLMAAIGAWLGAETTFYVFAVSSIAAGVYAVCLIVLYGKLGETWVRLKIVWLRFAALSRHLGTDDGVVTEARRMNRGRVVPFAAMMCLGVIATLVWIYLASGPR